MPDFPVPAERRVLMAGPLSKETRFSLSVEGKIGTREIKNLITFLQLQLEWASEDEAEDATTEGQS